MARFKDVTCHLTFQSATRSNPAIFGNSSPTCQVRFTAEEPHNGISEHNSGVASMARSTAVSISMVKPSVPAITRSKAS